MLFKSILKHKKIYGAMFAWALFLGFLPMNAFSMPIESKTELNPTYQKDIEAVREFLEKEAVSKRLADLGLSTEQIQAKLASVDSHRLHCLAKNIEQLEKAGGGTGIALVILAILLIGISFLYFTNRRITVEKTYE
jgi:hypothetical protein